MQTPSGSESTPRRRRAKAPKSRVKGVKTGVSAAPAAAQAPTPSQEADAPTPRQEAQPAGWRNPVAGAARAGSAALAARAWAVYTLGGGVIQALGTHAGIRARASAEDTELSRLANAQAAKKLGDALRTYHQYSVEGLQHIPKTGPVLVVAHHSLATYDIGLLSAAIRDAQGRAPITLVDRLIFKIPMLGEFLGSIGCVEAAPEEATRLLHEGNIVIVAPGGMREALRPSDARYTTSWQERYGFARLAIDTQVPVVCAACPSADDLYDVYPSFVTNFFLKRFHLPVPLLRGIGLTVLPRAQKLVHFIAAPMAPPAPLEGEAFAAQSRTFAQAVAARMNTLLEKRGDAGIVPN